MGDDDSDQPPQKKRKTTEYNKTKEQYVKLSEELLEKLDAWLPKADSLLARPGHGIPTVSDIKLAGRRDQDKNNL